MAKRLDFTPLAVSSRAKALSQSVASVSDFEVEVRFWKERTAKLSADPHKPPPTKVVPDNCPVNHEHHFWREHVSKLSSPTPGGKDIIDVHPPYVVHDAEVDYWRTKAAELCKPVDQLMEMGIGHRAARRRSYEHEDSMIISRSVKATPFEEDPVKSFAEWADTSRFEGQYKSGKISGIGKFTWPEGSSYEGEFQNNEIHGHGTYRWNDGRIFTGQWQNNRMNGTGTYTWKDGRRYIGNYINDKKEGHGVFTWPDGREYDGEWKYGKQHGTGVFKTVEGDLRCGQWKDGVRIRWISEAIGTEVVGALQSFASEHMEETRQAELRQLEAALADGNCEVARHLAAKLARQRAAVTCNLDLEESSISVRPLSSSRCWSDFRDRTLGQQF